MFPALNTPGFHPVLIDNDNDNDNEFSGSLKPLAASPVSFSSPNSRYSLQRLSVTVVVVVVSAAVVVIVIEVVTE